MLQNEEILDSETDEDVSIPTSTFSVKVTRTPPSSDTRREESEGVKKHAGKVKKVKKRKVSVTKKEDPVIPTPPVSEITAPKFERRASFGSVHSATGSKSPLRIKRPASATKNRRPLFHKKVMCIVNGNYDSQLANHLKLRDQQKVWILESSKNWCFGECWQTHQKGLFPKSFVHFRENDTPSQRETERLMISNFLEDKITALSKEVSNYKKELKKAKAKIREQHSKQVSITVKEETVDFAQELENLQKSLQKEIHSRYVEVGSLKRELLQKDREIRSLKQQVEVSQYELNRIQTKYLQSRNEITFLKLKKQEKKKEKKGVTNATTRLQELKEQMLQKLNKEKEKSKKEAERQEKELLENLKTASQKGAQKK